MFDSKTSMQAQSHDLQSEKFNDEMANELDLLRAPLHGKILPDMAIHVPTIPEYLYSHCWQ